MHLKTIGATGNAVEWLTSVCLPGDVRGGEGVTLENGVLTAKDVGTGAEFAAKFIEGISKHRVWDREVEHIAA
jgi:catalase